MYASALHSGGRLCITAAGQVLPKHSCTRQRAASLYATASHSAPGAAHHRRRPGPVRTLHAAALHLPAFQLRSCRRPGLPVGLCVHSVAALKKMFLQRTARSCQPPASRGRSRIVSDGASATHVDAGKDDRFPLSPASDNTIAPTPPGERHDTCVPEAEVGFAGKVIAGKGA